MLVVLGNEIVGVLRLPLAPADPLEPLIPASPALPELAEGVESHPNCGTRKSENPKTKIRAWDKLLCRHCSEAIPIFPISARDSCEALAYTATVSWVVGIERDDIGRRPKTELLETT